MTVASKIAGFGVYIPESKIDNARVLEKLLAASSGYLEAAELEALSKKAMHKIEKAGCMTRYWCLPEEYCTDIALKASRTALENAEMEAAQIDYIIFTGMSKAFVEPASAHVLRHELEAHRANVIDTQDACTSFIKSLQIADSFIRSGVAKTVLIAAGERTYDWADFRCKTIDELRWKFGSLTIGDAAGAVLLTSTDDPSYLKAPYHFDFSYEIKSGTYNCCHIGLNHRLGDRYRLYSHSRRLFETGTRAAWDMITKRLETDRDFGLQKIDNLFIHDIGRYAEEYIIPAMRPHFPYMTENFTSYFPEYGNVASVSLPLSLHLARERGELKRGNNVVFACPAAGVQFGVTFFIY